MELRELTSRFHGVGGMFRNQVVWKTGADLEIVLASC
jgi:hypothetical protein